jgi:hypothetical protein
LPVGLVGEPVGEEVVPCELVGLGLDGFLGPLVLLSHHDDHEASSTA